MRTGRQHADVNRGGRRTWHRTRLTKARRQPGALIGCPWRGEFAGLKPCNGRRRLLRIPQCHLAPRHHHDSQHQQHQPGQCATQRCQDHPEEGTGEQDGLVDDGLSIRLIVRQPERQRPAVPTIPAGRSEAADRTARPLRHLRYRSGKAPGRQQIASATDDRAVRMGPSTRNRPARHTR